MNNVYVFDTSVLINDPLAFKAFKDSTVIIPITVLDELDKLKKQSSAAGKHARVAIRNLDQLTESGDIINGIIIDDNIKIIIDSNSYPIPEQFSDSLYGDARIIATAYNHHLQGKNLQGKNVILLSNDINLRVRARAMGMEAASYENDRVSLSDMFHGSQSVKNIDAGVHLLEEGWLDPSDYEIDLKPNEGIAFLDDDGVTISLGKKTSSNNVSLLKKSYPWQVSPRNDEQALAIDLILDPRISLVTMTGRAGCGKTICALASALELVLSRKDYDKLVIYRPIQAVGNDLGYLPGSQEEKLAPWFEAIMDNMEVLFKGKNNKQNNHWLRDFESYKKDGRIEFGALTYIRGRSIPDAIILIDEAQNISKEDIKTILTRAGERTKIILTGDLEQIDNPALDAMDNGLAYVVEKFKDLDIAGHVTFTKGERSRLATISAEIL